MQIILKSQQITAVEFWKLAKKERDRRLKKRIIGLALTAEGRLSREAIAQRLKTDSDRVRAWIARYNQGGIDGLRDRPGRGAKPTMTPPQEKALIRALEKSPRAVQVNSNIWTGRAVQELLAKKGWFECSLGGAYAIIHRLGFTLQRPNRRPLEANPIAAKRFMRQLAGGKKAASARDIPSGR